MFFLEKKNQKILFIRFIFLVIVLIIHISAKDVIFILNLDRRIISEIFFFKRSRRANDSNYDLVPIVYVVIIVPVQKLGGRKNKSMRIALKVIILQKQCVSILGSKENSARKSAVYLIALKISILFGPKIVKYLL